MKKSCHKAIAKQTTENLGDQTMKLSVKISFHGPNHFSVILSK